MIKRTVKTFPLLRVGGEEGFSLVEVMVATALLLIGVLAIATGEVTSLTLNKRSAEVLKAVAAAENILEMIRRNPDANKLKGYAVYNTSTDAFPAGSLTMAQSDFNQWKSSVEGITMGTATDTFDCGGVSVQDACGWIQVGPGPIPKVKTVTIQIVWPSRRGGITIQTAIES